MKTRKALPVLAGILIVALSSAVAQPVPQTLNSPRLIHSIEGPELYKAYCASCHGTDGKGIGPMTKWLSITAPDLTRLTIREGGTFPLARVQRIITGTESTTRGHGTREMPVWGPFFSEITRDEDLSKVRVLNLAKYLEAMQAR